MQNKHNLKAVFTIVEGEKLKKPIFRRIGTGFVNKDDSLNIFLDAIPINGKLHIRDIEDRENDNKNGG